MHFLYELQYSSNWSHLHGEIQHSRNTSIFCLNLRHLTTYTGNFNIRANIRQKSDIFCDSIGAFSAYEQTHRKVTFSVTLGAISAYEQTHRKVAFSVTNGAFSAYEQNLQKSAFSVEIQHLRDFLSYEQ